VAEMDCNDPHVHAARISGTANSANKRYRMAIQTKLRLRPTGGWPLMVTDAYGADDSCPQPSASVRIPGA